MLTLSNRCCIFVLIPQGLVFAAVISDVCFFLRILTWLKHLRSLDLLRQSALS